MLDSALRTPSAPPEPLAAKLRGKLYQAPCFDGHITPGFKVVDTETLLDAQQHPERYPLLLVRVAGYSARFVDLTPAEQTEIISRTQKRL